MRFDHDHLLNSTITTITTRIDYGNAILANYRIYGTAGSFELLAWLMAPLTFFIDIF